MTDEKKELAEVYAVADVIETYFILDNDMFAPLVDFRTEESKRNITFSVPKRKGYVVQRVGENSKALTLTGFIFSTEAKPNLRETKKQTLVRALDSESVVKFEVEGEGTYEAVLTSIAFEDVGGEPSAYRYTIEALEVGYSDYSDHSNISHLNSTPHNDYAHSDHSDHTDSSHSDHSDHSDVAHGNSYPYTDSYSDVGVPPFHTNIAHQDTNYVDYTDSEYADNYILGKDVDKTYHTDWGNAGHADAGYSDYIDYTDAGWTYYDWDDSGGGWDSHQDGDAFPNPNIHLDWTNGGVHSNVAYTDHTDHTDSHGDWSDHTNIEHEDYSHDDTAHSDWSDHQDFEHSDWSDHQDGYEDWINHSDSEA